MIGNSGLRALRLGSSCQSQKSMSKVKKIVAAVFFCAGLFGAPVGNTYAPATIEKGFWVAPNSSVSFRSGYEGDFVSDGRLKQFDQSSGRVDCYEQHTNSASLTMNIRDRMDIYTILGGSKTWVNWRFSNVDAGTINRVDLASQVQFLWALGSRAILFEWGKATLGMGGRYSSCNYAPDWATLNGVSQHVNNARVKWRQWQVNCDLSYKIDLFVPYIGAKYYNQKAYLSDFSFPIADDESGSNSFENRTLVGLYLGSSISNGKYFMMNLEWRLIDEEAVSVTADFRF
jgi:hypothetical protein